MVGTAEKILWPVVFRLSFLAMENINTKHSTDKGGGPAGGTKNPMTLRNVV